MYKNSYTYRKIGNKSGFQPISILNIYKKEAMTDLNAIFFQILITIQFPTLFSVVKVSREIYIIFQYD